MKPGQRVDLIKALKVKLIKMPWNEVNLIFSEFKINTEDRFEGDLDWYCTEMLPTGEDENLVELYNYIYPDSPLSELSDANKNGHWAEDNFRLFLSHSTKNKLYVTQIKQELRSRGIECFVAHEDIKPTKEWLDEIEIALKTCHAVVAFINTDFKNSDYCDQEVGYALQRGILVVPVRMGLDPYGFMSRYQGANAKDKDPVTIADEIFKILSVNPLTRDQTAKASYPATKATVETFLSSGSFSMATYQIGEVEKLDYIPPDLIDLIKNSWELNQQISCAWGVSERVEVLIAKHEKSNSF